MPIKQDAFGGEETQTPEPKPAKRKRRTKEELIAAAVIPGDRDPVKVSFKATGTEGERDWLTAVELFRNGDIEFKDKSLKYAVEKMDQQRASGSSAAAADAQSGAESEIDKQPGGNEERIAGLTKRWSAIQEELDDTGRSEAEKIETLSQEADQVREQILELGGTDPASDEGYEERADVSSQTPDTGSESGKGGDDRVPPEAEIGDEVRIGSETYRVGHGRVLVQGIMSESGDSSKILHPKHRWQRELGTGGKGPWEKTLVSSPSTPKPAGNAFEQPATPSVVRDDTTETVDVSDGEATVQREFTEAVFEQVGPKSWKVGTGVLEKIGLPDYSSLQIGPNTMSGIAVDDGRRMEVELPAPNEPGGKRKVTVPVAAVEEFGLIADTIEYVTRLQRSHLIGFLEAVKPGSTQPQ